MNKNQIEAKIIQAVQDREIDGMYTSEIAEKFNTTNNVVLKILKKIISGYYPQFKESLEVSFPDGVLIKDGSTFTWGNAMDSGDKPSKSAKNRQHIYWFCY